MFSFRSRIGGFYLSSIFSLKFYSVVAVVLLFFVVFLPLNSFAETPEMILGTVPNKNDTGMDILRAFRGAIFISLTVMCYKAIRLKSKMAIAHVVWLVTAALLAVLAVHTDRYVGSPDFSYFSSLIFGISGIHLYASIEYLRRVLLTHNKSGLFDNMISVIAVLMAAVVTIISLKNPVFAGDILLYLWSATIIIGTITAIFYIVNKSVEADLYLIGWIVAQIGFVVVLGVGTKGTIIAVITSIMAWSSVIISHIFLAILTYLKHKNIDNPTFLQTKPNNLVDIDDTVSFFIDKAVFRLTYDKQKIILNEACAKMLYISGRKSEFSIDAFKGLVDSEYHAVVDKMLLSEITAPEFIKFYSCEHKGFVQPLRLKTSDAGSDTLFLYQEIMNIMPSVSQIQQTQQETHKIQKPDMIAPSFNFEAINSPERRQTSDVMNFITKVIDDLTKDRQITGDYALILLKIQYYDDWQVILGVSQTYQLIKRVTDIIEKSLISFQNLVVRNFSGDLVGIFCHLMSSDAEIERLKLVMQNEFKTPIKIGNYNIFVNFLQGVNKISATDAQFDVSNTQLVNVITNMIDSSKRIIGMYRDNLTINIDKVVLPQGSNILGLSSDLRYAPERDQMNAYYAPIIDLKKGDIIGFNVNPVWRHPDFGLISDDLLQYLTERCQMDNVLNRIVLAKAIEGMAKLYKIKKMPIMSFIITKNLLLGTRIDEDIKNLCDTLKISPALFRLEFSSNCLADNPKWLGAILTDLKAIGVTTVLNGLGSEKGQLSALSNLAFDRVIIDSGFSDNIVNNERKFFALKSLVVMLKNMAIKSDIKNVASKDSLKLLMKAGVSNVSGSIIGDPMPAERAVNILTRNYEVH